VDNIISEPLGGAHRNYEEVMERIGLAIGQQLKTLQAKKVPQLLESRYQRLMGYGKFKASSEK